MSSELMFIVFFWTWVAGGVNALAVTLWSENAENGATHVIDNTGPTYDLIQSQVVGQGSYSFHLANPSFADNSFTLNTNLAIQFDTKLFFLSRLGWATNTQFARVQVSTNGGASWPNTIYSQAGTNNSGEGSFSLREVNLGGYANQNVRLRFMYEHTSGSAYTQTDSGVGWYVDDIQIGDQLQKSPWSIGNPKSHEQLYLEYINRARADALVEAGRLRNESDPDVQSAYSFFGIAGQDIVDQFAWYVDNGHIERHAQPLSFQADLLTMAQLHTQDMFQNQFQGHVSSSNPPAPFQPGFTLSSPALEFQRLVVLG